MKTIPCLAILPFFLAAHFASAQITIDFSAEQGFTSGPLHRQPSSGERWLEGQGVFMVDAERGILTYDSSADNWTSAAYSRGLTTGDVYVFVIEFQLTVGTLTPPRGDAMLSRFEFSGEDGNVFAAIRQRGGRANFFDLTISHNVGGTRENQRSDGISGELIGLESNGRGTAFSNGTSKKLRLLIIHRNTGQGRIASAVVLQDASSGEDIQGVVHEWTATESWINEVGKRFRISTGNMNTQIKDNGATSIAIENIRLGVANE